MAKKRGPGHGYLDETSCPKNQIRSDPLDKKQCPYKSKKKFKNIDQIPKRKVPPPFTDRDAQDFDGKTRVAQKFPLRDGSAAHKKELGLGLPLPDLPGHGNQWRRRPSGPAA